jgi:hypothetical protein
MQEIWSVRLRVFVTSTPELPIRLGFENMSDDTHQDLVLHEIPKQIIDYDLFTFLKVNSRGFERRIHYPWTGLEIEQFMCW